MKNVRKRLDVLVLLRKSKFAFYGGLLLGIGACQSPTGRMVQRPNVIVIMADQWRAQAIGQYGDPNVKTPHIDALASGGVDFVNAVSGIPVCTPARASFLTGQQPLSNGVFMNDVQLDTNAVTLGKVFKEAGYATACIGKWHIDGQGRSSFIPPGNRRQGFDYWKVLECTHDYNNSLYYANTADTMVWEGYDAIAQTDDAMQYMREQKQTGQSFFLFLSWGPPHEPYQSAPAEYRSMYAADSIQLRPNVPEASQSKARQELAGYYAHCTALDDQLGKLMSFLNETGLDSNTIVLFLSDHGDMLGSQGASKKQQPYDESILVPMIFKLPNSFEASSHTKEAPIGIEDLMPTLLSLCGIKTPGNLDGLDYAPYILGQAQAPDTVKVITCVQPYGQWPRANGGKEFRGIRSTRFTYVRDLEGPWLFFDNQQDPYQQNNLVSDPRYQSAMKKFDSLLQSRLSASNDEFLPGLAYVEKYNYPPLDETETVPYTP